MPSLSSPTQSMDTVYPEPMSRLYRRVVPKKRRGGSFRYRTQPVTFSEIQEVDEENVPEESNEATAAAASKSELELHLLNQKFEEFKRTRDLTFSKTEEIDINQNTTHTTIVPQSTRTPLTRLPSRPSF